jgi:hypothetical protein
MVAIDLSVTCEPSADYDSVGMLVGPIEVIIECIEIAVPIPAHEVNEALVESIDELRPTSRGRDIDNVLSHRTLAA